MNASERVKLIKSITALFAAEEWPLIDLTLRQFKLPTDDNWNSSNKTA